jgi:uncharacterized damage-inducible protein DinB
LLTYAEGRTLAPDQLAAMRTELEPDSTGDVLFAEFASAIEKSTARLRSFHAAELEQARGIGKKQLPTSVGGLLVHVADHTQRHVGQAITTAKVVLANRKQT